MQTLSEDCNLSKHIVLYAEEKHYSSFREKTRPDTLHHHVLDKFTTEAGDTIVNLKIAYRVFGKANEKRDNIILVFHALTGDSNCAGYQSPDGFVHGWWEGLFSKQGIDPDKYCIICPNHPTSCYGSSGPLDKQVGANTPLGQDFPDFSVRDIVNAHGQLIKWLDIKQLHAVIGGSLGGMIALEWAIINPVDTLKSIVIAAPAASNAQSIAFNHIQKKCFEMDPDFKGGNYYNGKRPMLALSLARQIGMITYRSPEEFTKKFGRSLCFCEKETPNYYEIQSYLDYQGEKFFNRFDANSYIKLLTILDEHDVSRDRQSMESALAKIRAQMLFVSIDSDILYPPEDVENLHQMCLEQNIDSHFNCIKSLHGHDSFLIEYDQLTDYVNIFLNNNGNKTEENYNA